GNTVIFVENREGRVDHWARDPFVVARAAHLAPEHALASAAIPLIFPAIRIDQRFYCDGSLRLNMCVRVCQPVGRSPGLPVEMAGVCNGSPRLSRAIDTTYSITQ